MAEVRARTLRVGPYELIERLGYGGMAEVYVARYRSAEGRNRRVAIKRILPQFGRDPRFVSMFCDEARICAALSHPNIVQVFDFGDDGGELFMAMEFVDGVSCAKLLRAVAGRGQRFPLPVALFVATEVLKALEFAHEAWDEHGRPLGIVHRDVSPGNILVARTGEIKLTDFGIVRSEFITRRTYPGELKGKLGYMAPEQVVGKEVDPRSDLFALGIVLAEMLMARPLFPGPSEMDILTRIYEADLRVLHECGQDLPPQLLRVLTTALARRRADRFPNARAFLEALRGVAGELGLGVSSEQLVTWLAGLGVAPTRSGVREAAHVPPEARGLLRRTEVPSERPFETQRDRQVPSRPAPSSRPSSPVPTQRTQPSYWLHTAQGVTGPLTASELIAQAATGSVTPQTLVSSNDDLPRPVSQVPVVRRLLEAGERAFGDRITDRATWHRPLRRSALPELLFRMARQHETGLLAVRSEAAEKRIYWIDGAARAITSTSPDELLGARLTHSGVITPDDVDEALQMAGIGKGAGTEHLGEILVAQGKLAPTRLLRAVVYQLRDRFTDLGRWRSGELFFVRGELPRHRLPRCPAAGLISALVRRGYDGRELEELLGPLGNAPLAAAPSPPFGIGELELGQHESAVIAAAPGSRTLDRLVSRMKRHTSIPEPVVRRAVFVALSAGLLLSPAWPVE